MAVLNRALFARRLATADPYLAEVSVERALVARVGYGEGDAVADGRYAEALELPRPGARRVKRSMEAPDERFAALLGAREQPLVAEELVLRARDGPGRGTHARGGAAGTGGAGGAGWTLRSPRCARAWRRRQTRR